MVDSGTSTIKRDDDLGGKFVKQQFIMFALQKVDQDRVFHLDGK